MGDRKLVCNKSWPGRLCMVALERGSELYFMVYVDSEATIYKIEYDWEEMMGNPNPRFVKVY
jgi:hypothetical protein